MPNAGESPLDGPPASRRGLGTGDLGNAMLAVCAGLGMFLGALDIAVNVGLPTMAKGLNTDFQTIQWVIVAFVAARAGLVMGAGSFADRFGLRRVYLFGAITYLAAMVAISLSPTLAPVVGFRVLQALGTGSLFAVSPALASQVFPAHRQGLAMGFATASQALGMLTGTLGAGALVAIFGWQAVFFPRIPFLMIALVLAFKFLPKTRLRREPDGREPDGREPDGSVEDKPPFDAAGAVTLLGALICLVIGLRMGRSEGWTSPVVLTLLALAPLFLLTFWQAERRARWPVLPGDLIRIRGFAVSYSSMFLTHFGVFVIWFIFPFYIADGLGRGPGSLGVMLAAMALMNSGFSALGGWLCDRLGILPVGLVGLLILAMGLMSMSFLGTGSGLSQIVLRIGAVGAGMGLFQASAFALMLSSAPQGRLSTASAALSLAQSSGTVMSVAVVGGIFALSQDYHLGGLITGGAAQSDVGRQAFMLAFRDVFQLGAALVLAGAVVFGMGYRRRGTGGGAESGRAAIHEPGA